MAEMSSYLQDIEIIYGLGLPFDKLFGKNILVTGATGLIGGCLVDVLMHHPEHSRYVVYAMGRNENRASKRFAEYWYDASFRFVSHDVTTALQCDIQFDYIIHAASNASPNFFQTKPVEVMKANLLGIINLMEYGMIHGMKRMLYVSSGEVYGEGDGRSFREDDSGYVNCATPRACYPSSKRTAETLAVSYVAEYGVDVVIGRPCHTYGPHFTESDNRAYAQFIRRVMDGEDIILKSKGDQFRSWIYVVDCACAMLTILLRGASGEAYNVADEKSCVTIKDFATLLANVEEKKVVFDIKEQQENSTPITHATFSTEKLSRLGWRPQFTIGDALAHTVEEQRGNSLY